MKKLILFLLAISIFTSCKKGESSKNPEAIVETTTFGINLDWAKNAVIYEVNTRQFSPEGNFKGIENQLDRLNEMGIDILWLMPIHPISELKRKASGDVLVKDIEDPAEKAKYYGSPYSVADYATTNLDLGSMDDFRSLLDEVHKRGMKLIIDWVPNHTGWDHPWIKDHPEWYTKDENGQIVDPINPETGESWGWTDVADLDYSNKEMRSAMIDVTKYWLADIGIDGFRVDVAHGIPQDFWDEWTPEMLKAKPDAFLLAESEVSSHRNDSTFHATYGWSFHHLMNEIAKGEKNAQDIDDWYQQDRVKFKTGFHMHFTSNHDENTWAGTVFERMGDAHKALAVLSATFDGMPLLYSGQEEPMRKRLPFFTKEYIGFENYNYAKFYKTLFDLKDSNQAIWNGEYGGTLSKIAEHEDVYAFKREKNGDIVIGILNLSDKKQEVEFSVDISGTDVFTKENYSWKKGEKLNLDPWAYILLSN